MRIHSRVPILLVLAIVFSLVLPVRASAQGTVGTEIWLGGGISWPDYADSGMASARGGLGVVFFRHLGIGISGQADRERYYYFADATLILPTTGLLEPYARFHIGRRDDTDDTATGWTGGVRMGEDAMRFFIEAHGIAEPEHVFGMSVGISF
jgi:hypothetical protein